ncbi:hypothetical protein EDB85DRAFT_1885442 [Lactarius pseudohatsudake]|nr:hypothetical protein EDB85DRAFT_1885442 [Lactarius pseudohatsudake]
MALRTRRSQMVPTEHVQGGRNENQTPFQTVTQTGQDNTTGLNGNITTRVPPPTHGKRTFSVSDPITPTPSGTQLGAAKRTQTVGMCVAKRVGDETDLEVDKGPSHGRPMPLNLAQEGEIVGQQAYDSSAMKGKQVEKQGAPSSGRVTHVPSYSTTKSFHAPDVDDDNSISEDEDDDDDDDEQFVDLALKNPGKFAEVMATERPTWKEPGGIDTPRSAKLKSRQSTDSFGSSGSVSGHATAGATPVSTPTLPQTPGPRAHLVELSDEGVSSSADHYYNTQSFLAVPYASALARALSCTHPRAQPRLPALTNLVFVEGTTKVMLTSQRALIRVIVQDSIENLRASILFNNAFPDATVAFAFTREALIAATGNHGHGGGIIRRRLQVDDEYLTKLISLERCSAVSVAPIIAIGSAAEISHLIRKQLSGYNYIFPGAPGNMGITGLLYATLYEWRGGEQQTAEFSANAYMDVYLANVNTLKHILNHRERAYHVTFLPGHWTRLESCVPVCCCNRVARCRGVRWSLIMADRGKVDSGGTDSERALKGMKVEGRVSEVTPASEREWIAQYYWPGSKGEEARPVRAQAHPDSSGRVEAGHMPGSRDGRTSGPIPKAPDSVSAVGKEIARSPGVPLS